MTLQQAEAELYRILGDAYAADPSIRHDPFYRAIKEVHRRMEVALREAEDDEAEDAFQKWQAGRLEGGSRD